MTTITITPDLLKQLQGLVGPFEFRDSEGRMLGSFEPAGDRPTYDQLMATCPYSDDELRNGKESVNWKLTSEVLDELRRKWPIK